MPSNLAKMKYTYSGVETDITIIYAVHDYNTPPPSWLPPCRCRAPKHTRRCNPIHQDGSVLSNPLRTTRLLLLLDIKYFYADIHFPLRFLPSIMPGRYCLEDPGKTNPAAGTLDVYASLSRGVCTVYELELYGF